MQHATLIGHQVRWLEREGAFEGFVFAVTGLQQTWRKCAVMLCATGGRGIKEKEKGDRYRVSLHTRHLKPRSRRGSFIVHGAGYSIAAAAPPAECVARTSRAPKPKR